MAKKDNKLPLTIADTEEILKSLGVRVRYNILTHELTFTGTDLPPEHAAEVVSTIIFSGIRAMDIYSGVTLPTVENFLSVIAVRDRFNPVLDLLGTVKWDGTDRLPQLYEIMKLDERDILSRRLIKKWLMQTVALACFNDNDNDNADMNANIGSGVRVPFGAEGVLTLCGAQGIGKTSLIAKLGINSSLCKLGMNVDPHNKDDILQATGCFVCELGALESTMKRDIAALKAFLTAHTDEVRKPYARAASKELRRTSFAATCNSRDFLCDPTGNRRFFTIPCRERFDLEALAKFDPVQLYAQIFAEVSAAPDPSKCFRLSCDEVKALCQRNGAFTKTIPAEQELRDILDDEAENKGKYEWKYLTVTEFAGYYLSLNRYNSRQIGKALEQVGINTTLRRTNGAVARVRYVPVPKRKANIWDDPA